MPSLTEQFNEALRPVIRKELERYFRPNPLFDRLFDRYLKARSVPDCDCHACRASAFPPITPARTVHGAAAQEAAKPQAERKAPKPRPRSIAEEWEERR